MTPWPPECSLHLSPNCQGILTQGGAVLLGPPIELDPPTTVRKDHWCVECWADAIVLLEQEYLRRLTP